MPAKVVVILNEKGGCAKTTIAMQLGTAMSLRSLKTLIVTLAREGNPKMWSNKALKQTPFPFTTIAIAALQENFLDEIEKYLGDLDLLILNCASAKKSKIPWMALSIADLALIAIIPATDDYRVAQPTAKTPLGGTTRNPGLQIRAVMPNVRRGENTAKIIVRLLSDNPEHVLVLGKGLKQPSAFPSSLIFGTSVHYLFGAAKAVDGVEGFGDKVFGKFGMDTGSAGTEKRSTKRSPGEILKKTLLKKRTCERKFASLHTRSALGTRSGKSSRPTATPASTARTTARRNALQGKYLVVPLDQIDDNPYNARIGYDPETTEKLAVSISVNGQLDPALATKRGDRYILINGHYRKKALKRANLVTMKLLLRDDVSNQELYSISFKENTERHPPSAIDNAFTWTDLLNKGIYERTRDIAEAIDVSESTVSKTMALLKASPELIDFALNNRTLGVSVLYELYQLELVAHPKMALEMGRKFVEGHVTRDEIAHLRKKIATREQRRLRSTAR